MAPKSQFELSRIYAKGWSAGRASELSAMAVIVDADIDTLNPYQAAEERLRWAKGYRDALRRNEEINRGAGRKADSRQEATSPDPAGIDD